MTKLFPKLLVTSTVLMMACSPKSVVKTNEVNAVLTDFTGLAGCGWMLKLETADANGYQTLMPLNLDEFSITKSEGKKVLIVYKDEPAANTCMAGATVRLSSIR